MGSSAAPNRHAGPHSEGWRESLVCAVCAIGKRAGVVPPGARLAHCAVRERGPHIIRQVQAAVRQILEHEATMSTYGALETLLKRLH